MSQSQAGGNHLTVCLQWCLQADSLYLSIDERRKNGEKKMVSLSASQPALVAQTHVQWEHHVQPSTMSDVCMSIDSRVVVIA